MATPTPGTGLRSRLVVWLVEVPAVVVMFTMMVHVVWNALSRALLNDPVANTLEVVQYVYLPIVAMLGFVAAQHRGQHVAAELVFDALPSVTKRAVFAVIMVVCSALSAAFAWFGLGEALHRLGIGQTAGLTDIPTWWVYFLVPIAFGTLALQFLHVAWLALTAEVPGADEVADLSTAERATDSPLPENATPLERL